MLNQEKRRLVYLLVAVALVFMVAWLSSCQDPRIFGTSATTDSTHTTTTVTKRDTVVIVGGDSARIISIVKDVVALRKLMEELRNGGGLTSRGERNASVTLRVSGDTLFAEAACDSVELRLEDAITTINTLTERLRDTETTLVVTEAKANDRVPGWMRGTTWLAVVLGVLVLLIKLAFKFL